MSQERSLFAVGRQRHTLVLRLSHEATSKDPDVHHLQVTVLDTKGVVMGSGTTVYASQHLEALPEIAQEAVRSFLLSRVDDAPVRMAKAKRGLLDLHEY